MLNVAELYAVEGIMTTVFGVICFFFLPHTPADAKFLTEEERRAAMARLKQDSHGATDIEDVNEEKFNWHWVKMAFKAPQTWLSSLIWFFVLIPLYVSSRNPSMGTTVLVTRRDLADCPCRAELLPLPPYNHHRPGIHQHNHGPAVHRTTEHGGLRGRAIDFVPVGQNQGSRAYHGYGMPRRYCRL